MASFQTRENIRVILIIGTPGKNRAKIRNLRKQYPAIKKVLYANDRDRALKIIKNGKRVNPNRIIDGNQHFTLSELKKQYKEKGGR